MLNKDIKQYLEWKAGANKKKAALNYRLHLERFDIFCSKKLEQIQITDVAKFQLAMQKKHAMANVAYATTILKNFFKYYSVQNRRCIDPFLITIPKYTPNSHTEWTMEDFIKMDNKLSPLGFYSLQKKIAVRFLWETGLRNTELCHIKIADLDLKSRSIRVKNLKNTRYRYVMWTPETNALISRFLKARLVLNQEPAFFVTENGHSGITSRTLQRWVKAASKSAGIKKKIVPHGGRHGKAHDMLDMNPGCVKDIQEQLGHSDENPRAAFSYLKLHRATALKRAGMYLKRTRTAYQKRVQELLPQGVRVSS